MSGQNPNSIVQQGSLSYVPKNTVIPIIIRVAKIAYKELLVLRNKAGRLNSKFQKILSQFFQKILNQQLTINLF